MPTVDLLRVIADAAPMFIAYVDDCQRYRFVNKAYQEHFGRTADEIVGMPVSELLGPSAYEEVRQHVEAALSGRVVTHESLVHLQERSPRWLHARLVPHFGETGGVAGIVVLVSDETEHVEAQEALRQSEDRFRRIFEYSNDAIFVIDAGTDEILDANARACDMLGYSREELPTLRVSSVHPEEMPRLKAFADSVLRAGSGWTDELSCVTKTGRRLPAEISASAIDLAGRACVLAMVRDVTERRGAEAALRASEARAREQLAELEHVYRTAPVGLCLLDRDLRFLRISERLAALDGLPAADHIGRTVRQVVRGIADRVEPISRRVMETAEPVVNLELHVPQPGAPANVMVGIVSCHPLKSADGTVQAVSWAVHDITERKRAEEALRESEERLATIVGSAMDCIVAIDEDRVIRLFNAAAENVFRCTASDAAGTPIDRFASSALRELLSRSMEEFWRGGSGRRYLWAPDGVTAVRADGEVFPIEATISQSEAGGRKLYTIILRDVDERKKAEQELRRLQVENVYLRAEMGAESEFGEIVGSSTAIRQVLAAVEQVAATDSTVLITGETGTGKELVAKTIHERSPRRDKILVKVNCAALPSGLIESELFGHERGAFTGALARRIGRFELADGGTIFLDEIGDLPPELQVKLLRVLQEGEFERVGATETRAVDVRVIAATNRVLPEAIEKRAFRADLYYRLNVFPIAIPPIRERTEDIPALVTHLAMKCAARMGKRIETIPRTTMNALKSYSWPGNVRELQNVIERGVILAQGPELELGDWLPRSQAAAQGRFPTLQQLERQHIIEVLELTGWQVSGERGAARILDVKPTTLEARMKKLGISRPPR